MGQRGPNKKPTELKLLQGTYRPDRAPENEPKPDKPSTVPDPPSYLDPVAKKEWRRLAPELIRLGLLTVADLVAFETYCLAYGRLVAATKSLKKAKSMFHEYTNKAGATNFVSRPEIAVIQKESLVIKAFCAEFGLSPAARTRMEAPTILPPGTPGTPPPDGEKNSFGNYLNGPRRKNLSGP
ncbi:phage terminase small subunit P27 family [Paenibacillus sp. Pae108]|uniref:phage terminase small subunit P27 family n=1 Tax=Paenibacillus sp. Pae108 TaxID=2926019 RepID=UPI0021188F02|nr:phage terminase small subunit P27 family [Paenibacillus sp. Pae108]